MRQQLKYISSYFSLAKSFIRANPFRSKMTIAEDEGIQRSLDTDWVVSLKKRVSDTKFRDRNRETTIYRVPDFLKSVDSQAYEPLLVSLGPYHRDKPHLQAMNQFKWKCLNYVLEQRTDMVLEDYLDLIKKLETQARDAYSEEVEMDSNSFVEMMLLDGCFLMLTIMQRNYWMASAWSTTNVLVRDIFVLENQLPFFLLETLYDSVFPPDPSFRKFDPSFRELTFEFIRMQLSTKSKLFSDNIETYHHIILSSNNIETYHHIIHLFLSCIDPRSIGNGNQSSTFGFLCIFKLVKTVFVSLVNKISTVRDVNPEEDLHDSAWIPTATLWNEAGIPFVRKKRDKSFLDITFHNGKLEIPQLRIGDCTNSLLRNLIAYEQCSTDSKFHVTSYVVLMDFLINTAADVELLQQPEIIINDLGDTQQIATLFNKIGTNVFIDRYGSYLLSVYTAMRKHRDTRCNKWRARLNRDYFSNPWAAISLFGVLALFVLTVTQTTFTILSYFRSSN